MKKKIIDHPFRTIQCDYDETRAWTARDEKLLNLYIQLHDQEAKLQELALGLKEDFAALEKNILPLRNELELVKAKLAAAHEVAGDFSAAVEQAGPEALETLVNTINETNDMIMSYDKKIRQLTNDLNALKERENTFYKTEEEDSLWERLSELKITYFHDDNMSIDLAKMDDDEEEFRDKATRAGEENDLHLDYCESVTQSFNELLQDTEAQYKLWTEFGNRIKMLEMFKGSGPAFGDFSLN